MASAIANDAREVVMNRLNSSKGVKPKFEVNDKVVVYVPVVPSKDSAWKQKHLLHWRFATVIERISHTTYKVKDRGGRTFQRSIALIRPAKIDFEQALSGRGVAPSKKGLSRGERKEDDDMEHKPGDILAVHVALDGQNLFELGIVEKVENDAVAIWYLGTQGENINTARFHPVWACMKYNPIVYMLQEKQPAAYEQPKSMHAHTWRKI